MKIIKSVLAILFLSLMVSCSSDDSNSPVNAENPVDTENPSSNVDSFTLKVDGQVKTVTQWQAKKMEHLLAINGVTNDGLSVQIVFNKNGNVGEVTVINPTQSLWRLNYAYNRAAYFNFDMSSLNETNSRVVASFSGKVYDDERDLTSDFYEVEGNFNLAYTAGQLTAPGLGLSAVVNGQNWLDSGTVSTSTQNWSTIYNNFSSDNEYELSIVVDENTAIGSYTFNESSEYNKLAVFKYNPELGYEEEFVSNSGTLQITEKTSLTFGRYIIGGTFSGTASNPETGEVVTVTNGTFKAIYEN